MTDLARPDCEDLLKVLTTDWSGALGELWDESYSDVYQH